MTARDEDRDSLLALVARALRETAPDRAEEHLALLDRCMFDGTFTTNVECPCRAWLDMDVGWSDEHDKVVTLAVRRMKGKDPPLYPVRRPAGWLEPHSQLVAAVDEALQKCFPDRASKLRDAVFRRAPAAIEADLACPFCKAVTRLRFFRSPDRKNRWVRLAEPSPGDEA